MVIASVTADCLPMAALVIRAIDQEAANARGISGRSMAGEAT
jgi:hypothetical protein